MICRAPINTGPCKTLLKPLTKPCAKNAPAPVESLSKALFKLFKAVCSAPTIPLPKSRNAASPKFFCSFANSVAVFCNKADIVWFNFSLACAAFSVALTETSKALENVDCSLFKSFNMAERILAWNTPATCSRK